MIHFELHEFPCFSLFNYVKKTQMFEFLLAAWGSHPTMFTVKKGLTEAQRTQKKKWMRDVLYSSGRTCPTAWICELSLRFNTFTVTTSWTRHLCGIFCPKKQRRKKIINKRNTCSNRQLDILLPPTPLGWKYPSGRLTELELWRVRPKLEIKLLYRIFYCFLLGKSRIYGRVRERGSFNFLLIFIQKKF